MPDKIFTRDVTKPEPGQSSPLKDIHEIKVANGKDTHYVFQMPRVFTIFCHGTGGHRAGRCNELITEFGAAYWNRGDYDETPNAFYTKHYQKSFLILDGPGKSDMYWPAGTANVIGNPSKHENHSIKLHPTPGDFIPGPEAGELNKPLKKQSKYTTVNTDNIPQRRVSDMWSMRDPSPSAPKGIRDKHRGDIHGDGWDDNVAHVLAVLCKLQKEGNFPDVINLIGWSRGAVTTIKIAYWIDKYFCKQEEFRVQKSYKENNDEMIDYPFDIGGLERTQVKAEDLSVNIFAIDPVPGRFGMNGKWGGSNEEEEIFSTREGDKDYQTLAPIVRNCIITLAMDERRSMFAPITPDKLKKGNESSQIIFLPFPGVHRTQLRLEAKDPEDKTNDQEWQLTGASVPRIVWDLAYQFMTFHGTVFERDIFVQRPNDLKKALKLDNQLSIYDIVDYYAKIWIFRDQYHDARQKISKVGLNSRWRKLSGYRGLGGTEKGDVTNNKKNTLRGKVPPKFLWTVDFGVYTDSPGFFINEHHRWCFENAFPKLFKLLVEEEEKELSVDTPGLLDLLKSIKETKKVEYVIHVMKILIPGLANKLQEGEMDPLHFSEGSLVTGKRLGAKLVKAIYSKPLDEFVPDFDRMPKNKTVTGMFENMTRNHGGAHLLHYLLPEEVTVSTEADSVPASSATAQ